MDDLESPPFFRNLHISVSDTGEKNPHGYFDEENGNESSNFRGGYPIVRHRKK